MTPITFVAAVLVLVAGGLWWVGSPPPRGCRCGARLRWRSWARLPSWRPACGPAAWTNADYRALAAVTAVAILRHGPAIALAITRAAAAHSPARPVERVTDDPERAAAWARSYLPKDPRRGWAYRLGAWWGRRRAWPNGPGHPYSLQPAR